MFIKAPSDSTSVTGRASSTHQAVCMTVYKGHSQKQLSQHTWSLFKAIYYISTKLLEHRMTSVVEAYITKRMFLILFIPPQ